MKLRTKSLRLEQRENRGWYKWFAWKPKEIDGYIVWLEFVERKCEYQAWSDEYKYEYRLRGQK